MLAESSRVFQVQEVRITKRASIGVTQHLEAAERGTSRDHRDFFPLLHEFSDSAENLKFSKCAKLDSRAEPQSPESTPRTRTCRAAKGVAVKTEGTRQSIQPTVGRTWTNLLDTSNEGILELLEGNVTWWTDAAANCEDAALHLPCIEKQEELERLLLAAVYHERANVHSRLVERLRGKIDEASTPIGRRATRATLSGPGATAA
jgi:hypothetical protein